MNKLIWHIKQLLPLKYHTTYTDTATGQRMIAVWRMWLGRQFWVQRWELQGDQTAQNIVNRLVEHFGIVGDVDLFDYIVARLGVAHNKR